MIHAGDIMSTVGGVQYCGGTQMTKDNIPHGTEHPPVQNIPHGTQDIPHCTHDILYGTEHPKVLNTHACTHIIRSKITSLRPNHGAASLKSKADAFSRSLFLVEVKDEI